MLNQVPFPSNTSMGEWINKGKDMDRKNVPAEIENLRRRVRELEGVQVRLAKTERALRESEDRFRSLFHRSSIAYQSLDESGCYVDCNEHLCRLLGYSREELLGRRFDEFWDEKTKHLFPAKFGHFRNWGSIRGELQLVHKDGSRVTALLAGIIQNDDQGRSRTHCVLHDMTARKHTEDMLRETERRYRSLFEDAPLMYVITRNQGGIPLIKDCNELFLRSVGRLREEVVGKSLGDFFSAKSRSDLLEGGGYARALAGEYLMGERELLMSDGNLISTLLYTTPENDADGRVVGTRAMFVDITDRKHAEAKLSDAYDVINRSRSVAFLWRNAQGWPVEFVTENVEDLFGYTAEEFTSGEMLYSETVHPEDLDRVANEVEAYSNEEWLLEFHHEPYRIITKDGMTKWVEDSTVIRRNEDGEITHYQGMLHDITSGVRAQEQIRAQNRFLSSLLESVSHPFYVVDANDFTVVMANTAARRNSSLGKSTCYALTHGRSEPCYSSEHPCPLEELKSTGRPVTVEHVHHDKDGKSRYVEIHAYPIFGVDGTVTKMVEYAVDVTERRQMEESLRESEEKYRVLFSKETDAILVSDADTTQILDVNEAAERLYGYSKAELLCMKALDLSAEPERTRLTLPLGATPDGVRVPLRWHRKSDGTAFPVEISAGPLTLKGRPVVCSIIRDITGRIRAEEALKKSEKRYRALFDESIDGVYVVKRNGEFVEANQAMCHLLGYTREELTNVSVPETYFSSPDRAHLQRAIEEAGFVKDYRVKLRKKDGSLIACMVTANLWTNDQGTVLGYRGIIRDVTDWNLLEEQLRKAQRLESIATLAGGIAHDFNNLLTVISGYAELGLADNDENRPGYEELGIVLNAARRGADLVKQILTFSREVETKPKPTNLNHQVEHAEKLLYKTIPKMIEIRSHLADDLKVVMVDPTQVEQILLNLAVNARDAMPEGGTLTFKTENTLLDENYCRFQADVHPGEYACLTISDTGQGMESEVLDRIFEPFYTTKKSGEGTGLGLAMVFGIVKNHRGDITCHSEPGVGTTFKICFPVITGDKKKPEVSASGEFAALGTETILLVDDEDLIADLGKRILTKSGYPVLTASNGQEALRVYMKEKAVISLVIVDMIMPVMGGKECLYKLLKINPEVKVLIASGFVPDAETREAIETGAKGFVSKPFHVDKLLRAVREALDE